MLKFKNKNINILLPLILLSIIFIAMRLCLIDYSLFGDEFFTAEITSKSIPKIFQELKSDLHPPLFFILVHYSKAIFNSELGYRLVSIISSIFAMWGIFLIVRENLSRRIGWFSLFFTITSPLLLSYSQEARQYALFFCVVVWSTYFIVRFTQLRKQKDLIAFGILAITGFYIQYIFIIVFFVQLVFAFIQVSSVRDRIHYTILTFTITIFFLPWLIYALPSQLTFKDSIQRSTPSVMIFPKLFAEFTVGHTLFTIEKQNDIREPNKEDILQNIPIGLATILCFFALFMFGAKKLFFISKPLFFFMMILCFITPTVLVVLSFTGIGSFTSAKYSIATLLPLIIFLSAGIDSIFERKSILGIISVIGISCLLSLSLYRYYFARDSFGRWEDWRKCENIINSIRQNNPKDIIILPNRDRRQSNQYLSKVSYDITDVEELFLDNSLEEKISSALQIIIIDNVVLQNNKIPELEKYLNKSMHLAGFRKCGTRLSISIYSKNLSRQ